LDAGPFEADVMSFRLHLAAEGKACKTVRTYTEAVQWFAAAHLRPETGLTSWEEVGKQDVQRWVVWLLGRYSSAYASNQYRALQQFFKWLAAEEEIPDPMAGLKPPSIPDKPVPVFTAGDLLRLERACAGRTFAQRRDTAVIAVFKATGIRFSELAGIRYDAGNPGRSDVDLWHREITVQGKGRRTRTVKISFDAARSLDRYIRVRSRHAQAYRPQLWLGAGNRGPMTASGIYQVIVRRGRQCGIEVFPHRFRHHFSHTWLDHGGAEGDLMGAQRLDLPADAPPLRRQRPQRPSPPQLRPHRGGPAVTRAITSQKAPWPVPPRPGRGHRTPCASPGPPQRAAPRLAHMPK
jgi:site-specific recombinase XerD